MKSIAIKKKGVMRTNKLIALAEEVDVPVGAKVEVQIKVVAAKSEVDRSVFGMWKGRTDLQDSRQWVRDLRENSWRRSSLTQT
jgi:replicative DNA helicase